MKCSFRWTVSFLKANSTVGAGKRRLAVLAAAALLPVYALAESDSEKVEGILKNVRAMVGKTKDYGEAIRYLKGAMEKNDDPALRLELADLHTAARQEDQAISTLEELEDQIKRRERDGGAISGREKEVLRACEARLEKLIKGVKELHEVHQKVVKLYLDFARRMVKNRDFTAARLALKEVEKIKPEHEELPALRDEIQWKESRGDWRDLTAFPIESKQHQADWFHINKVPGWARGSVSEFQKEGVFLPDQKFFYIHPSTSREAFILFRFRYPIGSFKGSIAIAAPDKKSDAVFRIVANGKEVFRSKPVHPGEKPTEVQLKLDSCTELKLINDNNGSFSQDHCVWIDPKIRD